MSFPSHAAKTIRERLDKGLLPLMAPTKFWTGFGAGEKCDGCDEPIMPAQVKYQIAGDDRTIRFHVGCAGLWEAERRRRGYLQSD